MTSRSLSAGQRTSRARNANNYSSDFETATEAWNEDGTRVWLWGTVSIDADDPADTFKWGTNIDSFLETLQHANSTHYFHNLKFDGHFIADWLLKNGFHHDRTDNRGTRPGMFKTLISDMGKWYSLTIRWHNGVTTEIRDSAKKFPNMSVRNIAKSFLLEETKGDLAYDTPRAIDHEPTPEELDYMKRDVVIVARAIKETIEAGMKKLTVASDSLAEYKRVIGDKHFSRLFPVLSGDMDAEIRRAYRGGWSYKDTRRDGRQGSGLVLDVNSLYPSIMVNRTLPYGQPEYVPGRVLPTQSRPLTVFAVTFMAELKPGHLPCIQIKGHSMFGGTEYLTKVDDPVTLMVTNVDWELYNAHYDIKVIEWDGGWRFHSAEGMFDSYIDKWMEVKATSKGGRREIAKLHLNSLYGKMGSNPNVRSKYPVLTEDGSVKLVRGEDEYRNPTYIAAAVFITSFARDLTIRAAQENYDTFAYADTDSLHLLQDDVPETIDVHPSKLGAWKLEYNFDAALYLRAKRYMERTNDIQCQEPHEHGPACYYVTRIAGLPESVSSRLTFDDMYNGNVFHGKLTPHSVPGGVFLRDTPFELKM